MKVIGKGILVLCVLVSGVLFCFVFPREIKHLTEFIAQHEEGSFVCQSYNTHSFPLFPTMFVSFRAFSTVGGKKETKFIFFLRCFLKNEKKYWEVHVNIFHEKFCKIIHC